MPGPYTELGLASDISADPASDDVFETIRGWLDSCEKSHTECASTPTTVPRRLLFLEPEGKEGIRLIEDVPNPVRYAALSHCWGDHQGMTTTAKSLEQNKQQVRWSDIPKTFQDAITTCRKIGLQYIWIDSLCIIQDDRYAQVLPACLFRRIKRNYVGKIGRKSHPKWG
jgi:hypothetical protein